MNTMHLTGKGEWEEVTEVTVGSNPRIAALRCCFDISREATIRVLAPPW